MRDQDTGAAVEINAVTKRFGNVVAVADFSLEVQRGELVTLLGPSGCGKTTTLRIVAGFERPDSGRVFIFGREVTHVPPERRDVGMVFQNYALFPHMTVFQNVAFPMRIAKRPKQEICEKVREYLALVRLEGLESRYVTQLSDRVVVMNEGNIEQIGTPVEIYFRPRTLFVASFVGTMNFFTGKAMATEREVKLKWHEVLLSLPPGADVKPGETISVGVRPERLSLAFDGATIPPGHNVIPGEVSLVTFLGSIMRVEVMLADGTKGKIDLPTKGGVNPQRGQKVYLYFSPGDAVVLKTQEKGGGSGG